MQEGYKTYREIAEQYKVPTDLVIRIARLLAESGTITLERSQINLRQTVVNEQGVHKIYELLISSGHA